MKILHIITGLNYGGAEKLLLSVCKEQMSQADEVYVVYLKTEGLLKDQYKQIGVKTLNYCIDGVQLIPSFIKLHALIKTEKFDVINTHLSHASLIGRMAATCAGSRNIVNTVHSNYRWLAQKNFFALVLKTLNKFLNSLEASKTVAISYDVKNYLVKTGDKENEIHVIYNAVDFEELEIKFQEPVQRSSFNLEKNDFVISNIGRHDAVKGHIILAKALNELINVQGIKNIKCLLIGDKGNAEEELKNYIMQNGLEKNFIFFGVQDNPYKYLKLSNLFVMPSLNEGFGIAVLEAFFCEVPVLSTTAGGLKEIVKSNVTGITVESNNFIKLSDEIKKFYNNKYDVESLTRNAREFVKSFDIKEYVKSLNQVYYGKELI